jgi:hypothetical protein
VFLPGFPGVQYYPLVRIFENGLDQLGMERVPGAFGNKMANNGNA